jgi:hypothetical protein
MALGRRDNQRVIRAPRIKLNTRSWRTEAPVPNSRPSAALGVALPAWSAGS